jgi:peptide/nickel transport system substrate-binding protein
VTETGTRDVSRRRLLAGGGAAVAAAATAGCTGRVRSILSRDGSKQVSLSIALMPADVDRASVRIAHHLRSNLDAVGVDTTLEFYSFEAFRREFLVNQSFDIAVGPHRSGRDPDVLYGMFHSSFGPESGWQNPYGFTDLELDDLLEQQREETGPARSRTVEEILELTAREQPVAPLCVPTGYRFARPERVTNARDWQFDRASDVFALASDEASGASGPGDGQVLDLVIRRTAPTENLNPLAVEHRKTGAITGLVYDSLVVTGGGDHTPWLASSVEWRDGRAECTLREATWHDGEPVTASDVAFTYNLLADTSLGDLASPAPAPRFRGRSTLVSAVEVHDDRTVTLSLAGDSAVAPRALTVPILPEHVWRDRTSIARTASVVGDDRTTRAVVTDNIPPVGSGPYELVDHSERDELVFDRRPAHFAATASDLAAFRPPASRLSLRVAPSDAAAREWIRDGEADLTLSPVWHEATGDIDDSMVVSSPTAAFYHLAYNTRESPLSNVGFRRLVSRLVDRAWVVESVFGGTARPITTPTTDESWVPSSLAWDDRAGDPEVPFIGDDGTLDADTARDRLVELGYRYNEDGDLVAVGGG